MNKILVGKKITSDSNNVSINGNKISFLTDDSYEIEYTCSGKYNLTFVVDGNISILEYSFDKNLEIDNKYIVNKGNLLITKFYNNYSVNEKIDIDLCSPEATVDYKFSNICRENENYQINVNHKATKTISNIINKSVSLKNSKLHFIINSNVLEKSIKSILNQTTRIVTMDECDTSISPNMFIPIDDVEAKHGSIIGTFKNDDIFYLMSKGISYNDTLKLLIKGYILSNMIVNHEIRKRIMDIIDTYWR